MRAWSTSLRAYVGNMSLGVVTTNDAAIEQIDAGAGLGGQVGGVSHVDDGLAVLCQSCQRIKDLVGRVRIQVASRLVGNDDRGVVGDGTSNSDALLFPTGEFAGQTMSQVLDARQFQAGHGTFTPRAPFYSFPS